MRRTGPLKLMVWTFLFLLLLMMVLALSSSPTLTCQDKVACKEIDDVWIQLQKRLSSLTEGLQGKVWEEGWKRYEEAHPLPLPSQASLSTQKSLPNKEMVKSIALREIDAWGNGKKKEDDPSMKSRLNSYYQAGLCFHEGINPSKIPWSAAFVSYVMKEAGVTFPGSCYHTGYFNEIKSRPALHSPCKTYPRSNINKISQGDVLCACRDEGCPITYDHLPPQAKAHCDIVVDRTGENLELIGGNLGHSVKKTFIDLNDISEEYFGFISCVD